jgi:hypothetical protein
VYEVGLAAEPGDGRPAALQQAIERLVADLGADRFARVLTMDVTKLSLKVPSVAVVFWSDDLTPEQLDAVTLCRSEGVTVLPVVDTTTTMPAMPADMSRLNAVGWDDGPAHLARIILRDVGLCEPTRGVFISHRRLDGLEAAETLFEAFAKAGWRPFVDRFDIEAGADVQDRIDEVLEEVAFLLLLETPSAASSPWVQHEVLYALEHHMGVAIVNIDDAPYFPATADLPHHDLRGAFDMNGTHIVLSGDAVNEIVELVETNHAIALARRRRQLLVSAMAAASAAGHSVDVVPNWRLRVGTAHANEFVGVLPHLPDPHDLYDIDNAGGQAGRSVLVHAAHVIPADRSDVLQWIIGARDIDLVPSNAIGARWR